MLGLPPVPCAEVRWNTCFACLLRLGDASVATLCKVSGRWGTQDEFVTSARKEAFLVRAVEPFRVRFLLQMRCLFCSVGSLSTEN